MFSKLQRVQVNYRFDNCTVSYITNKNVITDKILSCNLSGIGNMLICTNNSTNVVELKSKKN